MILRPEDDSDAGAISEVVRQAFGRAQEALLVEALRRDPAFIPELSLVAQAEGEVVGHLLFTLAPIVGKEESWPNLALAPLSVRPSWQRQGVGSALMRYGLAACWRLGHQRVVVLGHADYYPRFGFTSASTAGIAAPFPVRDESFLVVGRTPAALTGIRGTIEYAAPFAEASS